MSLNIMDDPKCLFKSTVISELKGLKQKTRKYCKDCGEYGHSNMIQLACPIKIMNENIMRKRVKRYILNIDCLGDYQIEELFEILSKTLGITVNTCKKLYSEIPIDELIDRRMDIDSYIQNIKKTKCSECNCVLQDITKNRVWKDNILCDKCWFLHKEERDWLWERVRAYKKVECIICGKEKVCEGVRFHYDHINMFDKSDSICCMVDKGCSIGDIFLEIDKCQILCMPCHHIVTEIENRLCFTRIKTSLTKKFNSEEISEEEYINEKKKYQGIYEKKMKTIYEKLRNNY